MPALHLNGHDLRELSADTLHSWLDQMTRPVIIAEGIMMYLDPLEAERLLELIANELKYQGGRLIFDWVPTIEQPPPGLFGRFLGMLMRVFTGGQDFQRDERTRHDMLDLLNSMGAKAHVYDTHQVASSRGLPFENDHTQQLIFCADWSIAPSTLIDDTDQEDEALPLP